VGGNQIVFFLLFKVSRCVLIGFFIDEYRGWGFAGSSVGLHAANGLPLRQTINSFCCYHESFPLRVFDNNVNFWWYMRYYFSILNIFILFD